MLRVLDGLQFGRISLILPSGQVVERCGGAPGPDATLELRNLRPLRRLLVGGDVGMAESYIEGDWDSPDLSALIELAALNATWMDGRLTGLLPARAMRRLSHLWHGNSRRGSRRNIAFHYDLGNTFYRHWLDRQMIYSSALFAAGETDLERAQERKIERIVELLHLGGHEHVLEIGCGWGALAARIAEAGARVTGITLSQEQLSHAQALRKARQLEGRAAFHLQDYRDVKGAFDRIVSIEMIEAVGESYWPEYFATLRRCLRPGGRIVLQAITIRKDRFASYRRRADFIQTHVFPGGMLPTEDAIVEQARTAGLVPVAAERFGESYARTLVEWRRRFNQAWPEIGALGFSDRFRRLWNYYLCYCEGGFRAGTIDVGLYVFEG